MNAVPSPADQRIINMALLAGAIIILSSLAAYYNSFSGAFVFDDDMAIVQNPSIRSLWPIWGPLNPPVSSGGITVVGRPLLNLSFAVNYAISGLEPWSYHLINMIIQALAALMLFGIVRRTLLTPKLYRRFGPSSAWSFGLAAALLWMVHPLQTESVTYLSQRAESLAGMLYLLTLYCFIRGTVSPAPLKWYLCTVAACLLGITCKEVLVSAPLIALLYDRTFISSTFRESWRRRRWVYLSLAGTWLPSSMLVAAAHGPRAGAAGFEFISPFVYALTQCKALALYLKLSFWPHPLVIDYGEKVVTSIRDVLWQGTVVVLLLAGTIIALRRKPVVGFLGAWFFLVLAPSSSVMPVATQTMAEHRMYLPLAALVVLLVSGLHTLFGKRLWAIVIPLAMVLGGLTVRRNIDYRSELAMWEKTVAQCPANPRAHQNLGYSLWLAGRTPEAIKEYEIALRILPDYPRAHSGLGWILFNSGRQSEAIDHYREALLLKPDLADAHMNLGIALFQRGNTQEAMGHLKEAVRLRPDIKTHGNLGFALALSGRYSEAVEHFKAVLQIEPKNALAKRDLQEALDSMRVTK